ncbi:MAG: DUF2232 domain-containing protein [Deltaproteobacteria bacterium]|nr:DUF2232 domain-containing protein [Deltaproteobacteria bacterium]MBI3079160.1 DUF2232 domain-containing protein [Deltaproteobacteria bacterium]
MKPVPPARAPRPAVAVARHFLLGLGFTLLLFLAGVRLPLAGVMLALFTPLPALAFSLRYGRLAGALLLAAVALALAMLSTPRLAMIFVVEFACLTLAMAEVLRRQARIEWAILVPLVVALGGAAALVSGYAWSIGTNPMTVVTRQLQDVVQRAAGLYQALGIPVEESESMAAVIQAMAALFITAFPALLAFGTAVAIWMNILLLRRTLPEEAGALAHLQGLARWRTPDPLIWAAIAAGVLLVLKRSPFFEIGLNGLLLVLSAYFFQGMAIVSYFFQATRVPPLLRGMGYSLIAVQQLLLVLVVAVGMFDLWVDFRRLVRPAGRPEG